MILGIIAGIVILFWIFIRFVARMQVGLAGTMVAILQEDLFKNEE